MVPGAPLVSTTCVGAHDGGEDLAWGRASRRDVNAAWIGGTWPCLLAMATEASVAFPVINLGRRRPGRGQERGSTRRHAVKRHANSASVESCVDLAQDTHLSAAYSITLLSRGCPHSLPEKSGQIPLVPATASSSAGLPGQMGPPDWRPARTNRGSWRCSSQSPDRTHTLPSRRCARAWPWLAAISNRRKAFT